jgi:hypothetical protein
LWSTVVRWTEVGAGEAAVLDKEAAADRLAALEGPSALDVTDDVVRLAERLVEIEAEAVVPIPGE